MTRHRAFLVCAVLLVSPIGAIAQPAKVEFNRGIRPILSDNCFSCHGPATVARKRDLRLDTKDGSTSVIAPGISYGATDHFCYNVTENSVSAYDLQATILHRLDIDHTRLTDHFQGRQYRLTDEHGEVLK